MKLFKVLFLLTYRFLIMPIGLSGVFLFLWPFNKKVQAGIRLRNIKSEKSTIKPGAIWIHASSGEFEYAKPIIRELVRTSPDTQILVTYFSPSYAKQIEKFPGVSSAVPLPLDLPGPVISFLNKFKPRMLLIARTDLWPELLHQTAKKKIPTLLFSATFRPLTGLRAFLKPYYKMIFNNFSHIYAVSDFDKASILQSCTNTPILVAGDTRYDQVLYRLKNPKPLKAEIFSSISNPIFVAGSTWPEDELVLLKGLKEDLISNKIKLVLAPHEPNQRRLKKLTEVLSPLGLSFNFYTTASNFSGNVLIIDTVGILADLYTHGDFAFVGGSFKGKVHSVMEPLSAGLPTVIGPYYLNNREATQFKEIKLSTSLDVTASLNMITIAKNALDIAQFANCGLELTKSNQNIKQIIKLEINKHAHNTEKVIAWAKQNGLDAHYGKDFPHDHL